MNRTRRVLHAVRTGMLALGLSLLATTVTAGNANAINPAQTTESGVVNVLGGTSAYSIRNFWALTLPRWGYTYTNPTLRYYTQPVNCGGTVLGLNNSFWCQAHWTIYLDYNWNQAQLNAYGDFAPGGILAHEWGHAIDSMTGRTYRNYKDEYHADCLAGLYYHYGYANGRLLGADYYEFYNWLYAQPYSASHGTGSIRAAWFNWGYSQYTQAACDQVYASSATAASVGPERSNPGVSAGAPRSVTITKPALSGPGVRVVHRGELPAGSRTAMSVTGASR